MASRVSLVLTLSCAIASSAMAQGVAQCNATAPARDSSSPAYARRGSYCDGSQQNDHSYSGELAVIGVTATPMTGDPSAQPLRITALATDEPLELQGVAKSPKINYRLDAALRTDPLRIGSESAMTKNTLRLRAQDIAWVAWNDSPNGGRTYVPVVMSGVVPNAVEITVRPAFAGGYIVYSVWSGNQKLQGGTLRGSQTAGDPVSLTIDAGEPRAIAVKLVAVFPDGKRQSATIAVTRPKGQAQ